MKKHLLLYTLMFAIMFTLAIPYARADEAAIGSSKLVEKWNWSKQRNNYADLGGKPRDIALWNNYLIMLRDSKLYVLNYNNGKVGNEISTAGITGGDTPLSSIVVLNNKLYGCNAVTKAGETVKIYCWENMNSSPNLIHSFTTPKDDFGKKMSGSTRDGGNLYFTDGTNLYTYNIPSNKGTSVKFTSGIGVGNYPSSVGIVDMPETSNGKIWVFASNQVPTMKLLNGNGVGTCNTGLITPLTGTSGCYFTFNNKNYLAVVDYKYTTANFRGGYFRIVMPDNTKNNWTDDDTYLPDNPLGGEADGNWDIVTSMISEVSNNGKYLLLACCVPNQGIAIYEAGEKATVIASGPTNLRVGSQNWGLNNEKQHWAQLMWNAAQGHDHYELAYAIYAEGQPMPQESGWTSVDKKISASATEYWPQVPMGQGRVVYRLRAVDAAGKTIGESQYLPLYNLPFGTIDLKATPNGSTVNLSWTSSWNTDGLGNRPVADPLYTIERVTETRDSQGNISTQVTQLGTTNNESFTVNDYNPGTGNVVHRLRVRANFTKTISLASGNSNTVYSNTVRPGTTKLTPYFTEVETYDGRNIVSLTWSVDDVDQAYRKSYTVYRDGAPMEPKDLRNGSFVDMNLPDGQHSYYVELYLIKVDANGNITERTFAGRTNTEVVSIQRKDDVEQYGLEVIYNYPIVTTTEKDSKFSAHGDKVVTTTGVFNNGKTRISGSGAPGDLWRQAQYYKGKWYMAKLTGEVTQDGKTFNTTSENGRIDIDSHINMAYMNNTANNGGIYIVDANDPRGIASAELYVSTKGMENQSVGLITTDNDNPLVFFRQPITDTNLSSDTKDNTPTYANPRFTGSNVWMASNQRRRYIAPIENYGVFRKGVRDNRNNDFYTQFKATCRDGNVSTHGDGYMWDEFLWHDLSCTGSTPKDPEQYYRTHYMMAGGDAAGGTGYILMAPKYTNEVFRIKLGWDGKPSTTASDTYTKFVAKNTDGTIADGSGSSENLALPVRISNNGDFIHFLRGTGVYYVDGKTGQYYTISTNDADILSPAGETFTYNNQTFFLHGVCTQSNNPGNFRIEIVNDQHFTDLTPCASYTQTDEAAFESQGNSNANWYGTEYDATEDCMYIYQYVPGVRFAKYKLYRFAQFPNIQPTIETDVKVLKKFDGTGDEVAYYYVKENSWAHPADSNNNGYGLSPNATYGVDHYQYRLFDANGKEITRNNSWGHNSGLNNSNFNKEEWRYNHGKQWNEFNETPQAQYNTQYNWNRITIGVRPFFDKKNASERAFIAGEERFASHTPQYEGNIDRLTATAYKHISKNEWRVELNFNRADLTQYPLPVSYFRFQVQKTAGGQWEDLNEFYYHWRGGYRPYAADPGSMGPAYQYRIPGDYLFDVSGESSMNTRYTPGYLYGDRTARAIDNVTSYKDRFNGESTDNSVAWHFTTSDPSSWKYRVGAVYAANNPGITKTYWTEATPSDGGTTSVDMIGNDASTTTVYPVPAETQVTVATSGAIDKVEVYSITGAKVLDRQGNGETSMTLDVSALSSGIYMVRINNLAPVRMIKK